MAEDSKKNSISSSKGKNMSFGNAINQNNIIPELSEEYRGSNR